MRIAPFRALRYNPERISFISRVIAPPYDVIEADDAANLREKDPHNAVRLTLGKAGDGAHDEEAYRRAAETMSAWREREVLVQDEEPAVFVVSEKFTVQDTEYERQGVLCVMQLETSEDGVLPHEQTTSAPLADRLKLMEACGASLSPVFGIFPDPHGHGDAALSEMAEGWPLYEFKANDVIYRVWKVCDEERLRALAETVRAQKLLIADGHHRYETALAYRSEHRDPDLPPGAAPEDYLLLYAVSASNGGLKVLPTHRLVKAPENLPREQLVAELEKLFTVEETEISGAEALEETVQELRPDCLACYMPTDRLLLLRPAEGDRLPGLLPDRSDAWRQLAVTKLHYGVLEPLLDIPADAKEFEGRLDFTPDAEDLYWEVESGRYDLAFLLPPTRTQDVQQVADQGERMPPKSTYFYPKIPTGLVFYPLKGEKAPRCPLD